MRSSADPPECIPVESDRRFRIVTDDSGHSRKSVTFEQNERSRSAGTAGHVQAESVVTLPRITHHHGKLVIRGTRLPVSTVIGSLAGDMTSEEIQREYDITAEDIRAALKLAAHLATG